MSRLLASSASIVGACAGGEHVQKQGTEDDDEDVEGENVRDTKRESEEHRQYSEPDAKCLLVLATHEDFFGPSPTPSSVDDSMNGCRMMSPMLLQRHAVDAGCAIQKVGPQHVVEEK